METHKIEMKDGKMTKVNFLIKLLECLGKICSSVRLIIEKSRKYDQVEGSFNSTFRSKFRTYKIDGDRVLLRELMVLIDIADQIGLNGSTTPIREEIIYEHNLQLDIRPSSTRKTPLRGEIKKYQKINNKKGI